MCRSFHGDFCFLNLFHPLPFLSHRGWPPTHPPISFQLSHYRETQGSHFLLWKTQKSPFSSAFQSFSPPMPIPPTSIITPSTPLPSMSTAQPPWPPFQCLNMTTATYAPLSGMLPPSQQTFPTPLGNLFLTYNPPILMSTPTKFLHELPAIFLYKPVAPPLFIGLPPKKCMNSHWLF